MDNQNVFIKRDESAKNAIFISNEYCSQVCICVYAHFMCSATLVHTHTQFMNLYVFFLFLNILPGPVNAF